MAWIFEKASGCELFKGSSLAQKSLKFCKLVAAAWNFLRHIAFNQLVGAN